jgi:hypothetical protein
MYPDRPAGRRKGQADRSTNPSGRTGHKHRMLEFASRSRHLDSSDEENTALQMFKKFVQQGRSE